ncbi:hypothetical protein PVK06_005480 [Gossypium arboreum]|uniref:Uncharacterized protein n=1 Tax=Gossypium arboreum TaxID=29729 RepID=A0ABR0QUX0_GOSAR|nr:hypothetical protein PVK06_005480 [Gossypium arboreum]
MGSHAHMACYVDLYALWPTRPKLALTVWIARPGPVFHMPMWFTRMGRHTHVAHTAHTAITRPCHAPMSYAHNLASQSHAHVLPHGLPHGRPHTRVAPIDSFFGFRQFFFYV